jgi:acyl carrier protein
VPDIEAIRGAVRQVVVEMVGRELPDSAPLISSGLIDSLSILTLMTRLDKRLGLKLSPAGLQPDDFDSIDIITSTVQRASGPQ